jgi:protein-disulfide isomerase
MQASDSTIRIGIPASLSGAVRQAARVAAVSAALAMALSTHAACVDAQSTSSSPSEAEVLATVGDSLVTTADLRTRIGTRLDALETQYLRERSQVIEAALEDMVRERLFRAAALRQGITVEELIATEAAAAGGEPGELEISAWYQANQARVGGRSLDQVRPQIAELLRREKRRAVENQLAERLKREIPTRVTFEPYRFSFENSGAPSLGEPEAPVAVVVFSDFQCPFCQRFAPTLKRLADEFGPDIHVVFRQFPIVSIHPNAFKAAEGSLCGHEQGKFWELHDLMFSEPQNLTVSEIKAKAGRLGLQQQRFNSCLDSGRYVELVQGDLQEGERAGVQGTPAVFVNGVHLPGGAVPYATVAAAVRRELDRARQ